jgi:DNA-binding NtrC family response regulator
LVVKKETVGYKPFSLFKTGDSMAQHFLVVEDDALIRHFLKEKLSPLGRVFEAENQQKAKDILGNVSIDIAFIDLNLSDSDELEGLEVLRIGQAKQKSIVLTSHEEQEIINQAFELGCNHYFSKSELVDSFDEKIAPLLKQQGDQLKQEFFEKEFNTKNETLRLDIDYILSHSRMSELPLLITGPTGVGKSHLAQSLHKFLRKDAPFVEKNLTEVSENLFESELFGHIKGAFTGAVSDKVGLLEKAHNGTLFLDEIGLLPLHLQQKLLKVIEEKKFSPVGSNRVITSNFRLVTATCEDLADKMARNEFRIDFYFRLKGMEVTLPALKDRREDIMPMIYFFINRSARKIALSKDSIEALEKYDWFGNIRELKNFVDYLISIPQDFIKKEHLPAYLVHNECPLSSNKKPQAFLSQEMRDLIQQEGLPALIKKIELEAMKDALKTHGRQINEISRRLRISKSVFYRILGELENDPQRTTLH